MVLTSRLLPVATVILFALIVVTPACGYLFGCGCDWPWNGLAARCTSVLKLKPGCPWCDQGSIGFLAVVWPIAAGLACARLGTRVFRDRREGRAAEAGNAQARLHFSELIVSLSAVFAGVMAGLLALGFATLGLLAAALL